MSVQHHLVGHGHVVAGAPPTTSPARPGAGPQRPRTPSSPRRRHGSHGNGRAPRRRRWPRTQALVQQVPQVSRIGSGRSATPSISAYQDVIEAGWVRRRRSCGLSPVDAAREARRPRHGRVPNQDDHPNQSPRPPAPTISTPSSSVRLLKSEVELYVAGRRQACTGRQARHPRPKTAMARSLERIPAASGPGRSRVFGTVIIPGLQFLNPRTSVSTALPRPASDQVEISGARSPGATARAARVSGQAVPADDSSSEARQSHRHAPAEPVIEHGFRGRTEQSNDDRDRPADTSRMFQSMQPRGSPGAAAAWARPFVMAIATPR